MKVKNEYVQIKMGNRIWTHKNMIFNEYLKRLFKSQTETIYEPCYITKCYIKLDEPIENVDYDSEIYASDFDISISESSRSAPTEAWLKTRITTNENSVKVNYIFDTNGTYRIKGDNLNHRASILNKYANRKIAAIGFGSYNEEEPLLAFLDTSNMNIIINYNENFTISRLDTFQSDGLCDGYDFPLHFANDLLRNNQEMTFTKAKLYSVGFGSKRGIMEEEYLISDVQTDIDDYSITLNVNREEKKGVYLNDNLHLGFTPTKDNSKYLIFKYRLYVVDTYDNLSSTNKYYTMSVKNDYDFGDLEIKLKMERL